MIKLILLLLFLSGCGCKLSVDDIVTDKLTGDTGIVENINDTGVWTGECTAVVRYDLYRKYSVHAFTLTKGK